MKKNILMASVLLLFMGCSDKEPTPKAPTKDKVEIRTSSTESSKDKVEPKVESKVEIHTSSAEGSIPKEFVPEHVRRSSIEVVERY